MSSALPLAGLKKPLAAFRKSPPIDFSLLDHDDQSVMYISEDAEDWTLHLTIANTSSQPITLAEGQDAASPENHHFALRFRAGTLSKRTLLILSGESVATVAEPKEWSLSRVEREEERAPNAPVTLYLLYKGASRELVQNVPRQVKLSGISAAPGVGARGTQVELIPNPAQVKYTSDGSGVTGSRTQ